MKIRTSINVVFIVVGIVSSIIMANIFFELMRDHHKEGASAIAKAFLLEAATDNSNGHDITHDGTIIRKHWDDLPQEMRAHFSHTPKDFGDVTKSHVRPKGIFNPQRSFFVLYTTNAVGDPVYVGKEFSTQQENSDIGVFGMVYWRSLLFSIIFAAVFAILLVFVLKAIVKPLESLKLWANAMADPKNAPQKPIHFRYKELSDIADTISHSIERQREALKKEEEFLQFSSHELRTPLAVLRSNIDLLKKILPTQSEQEQKQNDKIHASVQRMDGATQTMTHLVETFLHISRDEDLNLEATSFDLQNLIHETLEELSHLHSHKNLSINLNTQSFSLTTHHIPCQIVLRNIFANALQHATQGSISITQEKDYIRVINEDIADNTSTGFGLGLRLVKKLAVRYGWNVQSSQGEGLYAVEVLFHNNEAKTS